MYIIMCYIYIFIRVGFSCVIFERFSFCSGSVGWREVLWNFGRGVVFLLGIDIVFKVIAVFVGLVIFYSLLRKSF